MKKRIFALLLAFVLALTLAPVTASAAIPFAPGVTIIVGGEYELYTQSGNTGDVTISTTDPVTIEGAGQTLIGSVVCIAGANITLKNIVVAPAAKAHNVSGSGEKGNDAVLCIGAGTLTLINCTIAGGAGGSASGTNNNGGDGGDGVRCPTGKLTLYATSGTTITGGAGGASAASGGGYGGGAVVLDEGEISANGAVFTAGAGGVGQTINSSGRGGVAIYAKDETSMIMTDCAVTGGTGNTGEDGIYFNDDGSLTATRCAFAGGTATASDATGKGGTAVAFALATNPFIIATNSSFAGGNGAATGGDGFRYLDNDTPLPVTSSGCTFSGGNGGAGGQGMNVEDESIVFKRIVDTSFSGGSSLAAAVGGTALYGGKSITMEITHGNIVATGGNGENGLHGRTGIFADAAFTFNGNGTLIATGGDAADGTAGNGGYGLVSRRIYLNGPGFVVLRGGQNGTGGGARAPFDGEAPIEITGGSLWNARGMDPATWADGIRVNGRYLVHTTIAGGAGQTAVFTDGGNAYSALLDSTGQAWPWLPDGDYAVTLLSGAQLVSTPATFTVAGAHRSYANAMAQSAMDGYDSPSLGLTPQSSSYSGLGAFTFTSNGSFSRFASFSANGATLTNGVDYAVERIGGGTRITMTEADMRALSGQVNFRAVFTEGAAGCKVLVNGVAIPSNQVVNPPKTGDASGGYLFLSISAVILALAVSRRKKRS